MADFVGCSEPCPDPEERASPFRCGPECTIVPHDGFNVSADDPLVPDFAKCGTIVDLQIESCLPTTMEIVFGIVGAYLERNPGSRVMVVTPSSEATAVYDPLPEGIRLFQDKGHENLDDSVAATEEAVENGDNVVLMQALKVARNPERWIMSVMPSLIVCPAVQTRRLGFALKDFNEARKALAAEDHIPFVPCQCFAYRSITRAEHEASWMLVSDDPTKVIINAMTPTAVFDDFVESSSADSSPHRPAKKSKP